MQYNDLMAAGDRLEKYIRAGRITAHRATEILLYLDYRRGRQLINDIANYKKGGKNGQEKNA